jgi:1-deoxy-D-xylulose-5-phosphate reductoisomerase
MREKILILGSTGSIGKATLEVIENQNDAFEVVGLACKGNVELLNKQIAKFKPKYVCVDDGPMRGKVHFDKTRLLSGIEGIKEMVHMDGEIVVNALPGSAGLEPTIETLKLNKILALANKESLVMAGRIVSKLLGEYESELFPVDSEHSAIFQLLKNIGTSKIKNITITASGGPFRKHIKKALHLVSPEEALNHPTWKMGRKVTLDSATLMNKGLEAIEARWLFDVEPQNIKVLIHPESIVHGMVELIDGASLAYMASPDMKLPISFAINRGTVKPLPFAKLKLEELQKLRFYLPDTNKFPSLKLAFDALHAGDGAQVVLNASNEVASEAFIEGKIKFTDIPVFIEKTLERHEGFPVIENIETVWEIHEWAKRCTEEMLKESYA